MWTKSKKHIGFYVVDFQITVADLLISVADPIVREADLKAEVPERRTQRDTAEFSHWYQYSNSTLTKYEHLLVIDIQVFIQNQKLWNSQFISTALFNGNNNWNGGKKKPQT